MNPFRFSVSVGTPSWHDLKEVTVSGTPEEIANRVSKIWGYEDNFIESMTLTDNYLVLKIDDSFEFRVPLVDISFDGLTFTFNTDDNDDD